MIIKGSMSKNLQESRKLDHIDLAKSAQTRLEDLDTRFFYEPMLACHPDNNSDISVNFLSKKLKAPLWISSMTGGVGPARHINQNLALVCREFGLGMGLGSCRVLLDSRAYFDDFNLRPIIGEELPLYANLGIAQVEQLFENKTETKIKNLLRELDADGLIVHINPLQEWFQPEGDRLKHSPFATLTKLCEFIDTKIIVKEVGQGFGPKSLEALFRLPIVAIELSGFGGTNFTKLEQLRNEKGSAQGLTKVGHTASEMVAFLNQIVESKKYENRPEIIISGGINNMLDGIFLKENIKLNAVIGQAKNFLTHAENINDLRKYTQDQINILKIAKNFLVAKDLSAIRSFQK